MKWPNLKKKKQPLDPGRLGKFVSLAEGTPAGCREVARVGWPNDIGNRLMAKIESLPKNAGWAPHNLLMIAALHEVANEKAAVLPDPPEGEDRVTPRQWLALLHDACFEAGEHLAAALAMGACLSYQNDGSMMPLLRKDGEDD